MKTIMPCVVGLFLCFALGVTSKDKSYYKKQSQIKQAEIEDLKDCRMSLHAYILRERGEMEYPKNPNICHVEPLAEQCDCFIGRLKWDD